MYVCKNHPSPAVYVELSHLLFLLVFGLGSISSYNMRHSTRCHQYAVQYQFSIRAEQWLVVRCWPYYYSFLYVTTTCTHKPHATRNFKSIQLTVTITIFLKHKVGKHQHSYCCTRSSGALWQMRKVKCSISYLYNTHGQTIY